MLAGLTAGAIAAIIAALVSLPLHSPVDSAFNSATVAVACLVLGLIAGLLWNRWGERPLLINGVLGALFVVVLIVAFVGNSLLDRFLSFVLPLAAIAFVVCALLTPLLSSYFRRPNLGWKSWTPATVAVIAALVVGFALITQGDAESGELALPPPPSATATPAPAPTAAAPIMVPASTATRTPVPMTVEASPATAAPTVAALPGATSTPAMRAEPTPTSAATEPENGEEAQSFIIGEGSKITFTVEEELGRAPVRFDAVISSTGLSGTANLDGQPSVVTLDLHSLTSDQNFRDQYIRSKLFPDTPEAVVTVDQLPDLPQSFFDGEESTGQLDGSLQIGETVTSLVFDVTARKDGNTINILGVSSLLGSNWGWRSRQPAPSYIWPTRLRCRCCWWVARHDLAGLAFSRQVAELHSDSLLLLRRLADCVDQAVKVHGGVEVGLAFALAPNSLAEHIVELAHVVGGALRHSFQYEVMLS